MAWELLRSRGSPPRMRGKECNTPLGQGYLRITPAYAGKSRKFNAHFLEFRDHPRVCGEKFSQFSSRTSNLGSPPRMRGKAEDVFAGLQTGRITPAYAGKSHDTIHLKFSGRDHPRVCGEK